MLAQHVLGKIIKRLKILCPRCFIIITIPMSTAKRRQSYIANVVGFNLMIITNVLPKMIQPLETGDASISRGVSK